MEFWPEFFASSCVKEFVAGGFGGTAGVIAGYPLDTLKVQQQHHSSGSALQILRRLVASNGLRTLYRGMAAPLASVTFQNAIAFQTYATFSRATDPHNPPSFRGVALGGTGTGAVQSLILCPVELVKIHLQLQQQEAAHIQRGPLDVMRTIFKTQGLRGVYRGLAITLLKEVPSHGAYFWTYKYTREKLHPGCRKNGQETFGTMLLAGGMAGVASWMCCYPLDVVKTRIQAECGSSAVKYDGIADCFRKSVREEGPGVLWRGLGTTVARAFIVNGAIFTAYETAMRCI
ncbi:Mitochondrial arginine transporter BAC2 [Striga hermonthica]|uniref:Mitochondrial arginine transporter BAC2 n=1 Tax=Striga hermonthica TaxID=68872 RepID=A0A9N7NDT5_STRHE|nr:Mitochondrial arginine transporter BAC2 [Striga hermonthica]